MWAKLGESMALQATRNTPPIKLNPYLTESPEKNASKLRSKALAYNVLSKITMVAVVAICAVVLAVSLGIGTASGTFPLILVGLAIATPFLSMGASKLHMKQTECAQKADIEQKVFEEFKIISDWKTPEIEQFFQKHNLSLDKLPIEELKKLNDEPLKALLPLIARFNYLHRTALELEERALVNYRERDQSDENEIRVQARRIALEIHNYMVIPKLFDAAVMLISIANPVFQMKREEIGSFKDFQMWAFDRLLSNNDEFFLFHQAGRPALTHAEIDQNLTPAALRLMISPNIKA